MFWQKSCEMTDNIGRENGKPDSRGFEMEFGDWCMRATLDIIGYDLHAVTRKIPLTPSQVSLVSAGTSALFKIPQMSSSQGTMRFWSQARRSLHGSD